jgi:hypothetical protein
MHAIDWPALQPPPADLDALHAHLRRALPLRSLCRSLVETTLRAYPWSGRADLIPCYHPAHTYKPGQKIALFLSESGNTRPAVWLSAQVRAAQWVHNPVQGRFQALTLELGGRQIQMASGIAGASYSTPDITYYTPEQFAWLVEWVTDTHAAALQATVKKLIRQRQLRGKLAGETFLPEQLSALAPELLEPVFAGISAAHPWLSLEDILKGLPDLAGLDHDTVRRLQGAALKKSPYRSLGGGRWTTAEQLARLDRDVPYGLPAGSVRSKAAFWTKQDEQDLAGYNDRFLPAGARHLLEELGFGEVPSEAASWVPPQDSLRLPALSYLHVTQGYFPVRSLLHAFAPDVPLVFVQFVHGDHLPFLLDRKNGLLKAVHRQELYHKMQEADLAAGMYLWLEYQGGERFRIAPRGLPFKRRVPCKLAYLDHGQLRIAHSYTSMAYEGEPSLFRAELRFEELENLLTRTSHSQSSVRETMLTALQEICATDPDHRAHWLDLFNAIFLQRVCSPGAVAVLLYSQTCFESLGGGYFRYKAMQNTTTLTPKRTDRLSRLWDDLLAEPVPLRPSANERRTAPTGVQGHYTAAPALTASLEISSLLSLPVSEPEIYLPAAPYEVGQAEKMQPVFLHSYETEASAALADTTRPVSSTVRENLERLFQGLLEPDHAEAASLPTEGTTSEQEAAPDISIAATHEEALSFSSPFRWEPKPAWVNASLEANPPPSGLVDPRQFTNRTKIPIRPLHKQPFYKRIVFYLRRWLSKNSRNTG